jgi:hypothetical protein
VNIFFHDCFLRVILTENKIPRQVVKRAPSGKFSGAVKSFPNVNRVATEGHVGVVFFFEPPSRRERKAEMNSEIDAGGARGLYSHLCRRFLTQRRKGAKAQ